MIEAVTQAWLGILTTAIPVWECVAVTIRIRTVVTTDPVVLTAAGQEPAMTATDQGQAVKVMTRTGVQVEAMIPADQMLPEATIATEHQIDPFSLQITSDPCKRLAPTMSLQG